MKEQKEKEKGKAGCFFEFIFYLLAVVVALASFALVLGGVFISVPLKWDELKN